MFKVIKNSPLYVLAFLLSVTAFVWYAVLSEERGNVLTVAFLDVGQGDSILTSVTQYTCWFLG